MVKKGDKVKDKEVIPIETFGGAKRTIDRTFKFVFRSN